ncbi:MAG: MoxR family ATPase [Lachnospiraceae bacterium]|nr:MoxR family ATPase [Lachnospiraceae bacterium]
MSDRPRMVENEIKKVIHGKDEVIRLTVCAVLAGGHVLLEDIPGVGKTTLALSLSKALSMKYRRVQFTPDVLPSDLLGFSIFDRESNSFKFQEGSIYTNLFLADEINRTSPKTQSALLEVMEERHATVEGVTREVPEPFFVIATQNPFGSSGTQRLPESQLDRFMVCLSIGYPDHESAVDILKGNSSHDLQSVQAIITSEELIGMQREVENLRIDESIYDYVVRLTEASRDPNVFALGLSPRGSIALARMARAYAFYEERDYVTVTDIHDVFHCVSNHRVRLNSRSKAAGLTVDTALDNLLKEVKIPKI